MSNKFYYTTIQDSLYVSDLDGTLFNSKGVLTDNTVKIINSAIELGIKITFATGKSYQTVEKQIGKLNLNIPNITYDGACINDCNGKIILCNQVEKNMLYSILKFVYSKSSSFLVYCLSDGRERIYWSKEKVNKYTMQYFSKRMEDKRFYEVHYKECFFEGEILFIAFLDSIQNIKKIEKELLRIGIKNIQINQDAYIKPIYWLKVKHPNANKGNAITLLKKYLNCDYVVSFGNATNDIEMFQASDVGLCVENANNIVKSFVTDKIQGCDNEGVAKFIEKILFYKKSREDK